jgi:DivIVA domain-containing protein
MNPRPLSAEAVRSVLLDDASPGYDPDDVDPFVDEVASTLEALYARVSTATSKAGEVLARLDELERRLSEMG